MLGKLIKYELKAMGRVMLPMYGVIMIAAAVMAFSMRMSMSAGVRTLVDKLAISPASCWL